MPSSKKSPPAGLRSACPIAGSLDLVGDRWSLLVIRDLFRGLTRYGEFAASPERIPTNILADRLVRLDEYGLISSEPYQKNPTRYAYALTAKGRTLKPLLAFLGLWGARNISGTKIPAELAAALRDG